MEKKSPIKVIKRGERAQQEQAAPETEQKKSAQETAREMVTTVTGWVNEFQQRRRRETKQALSSLFSDSSPRPSQA